jgi:hypothetical protein
MGRGSETPFYDEHFAGRAADQTFHHQRPIFPRRYRVSMDQSKRDLLLFIVTGRRSYCSANKLQTAAVDLQLCSPFFLLRDLEAFTIVTIINIHYYYFYALGIQLQKGLEIKEKV